MSNESPTADLYEQTIIVSFLLFQKSLQLYAELGNQVIVAPTITRHPKVQKGLQNLMTTIDICGDGLKRLPVPPRGIDWIDQQFRALGEEILQYGKTLRELGNLRPDEEHEQIIHHFQDQSLKIKEHFRTAIESYESLFPGRLSQALQTVQPGFHRNKSANG